MKKPTINFSFPSVSFKYTLPLLTMVLLLVFLRWVITTVIPIIWVETKYQYHLTLTTVFHVPDLRSLIMPDFSWFDWEATSQYAEYGIRIPAIFLDEPVVFNVDPNDSAQYTQALKEGIAHASSTALPDSAGLGYYFAHSSSGELDLQRNAIFYLLGKLEKDDKIFIWYDGRRFEYSVYDTTITRPGEVEFLYQAYQGETIVLQTCWPPGGNHQRFLVFARRVIDQ
jgi:LPXTG-site transpeptidase (sortase) family protein